MHSNLTPVDVNNYSQWFVSHFQNRHFWFGPLIPPSLNFAALASQQHFWNYTIDPSSPLFGSLSQPTGEVSASLARILVETGIAVTPAGIPLNDFRAGFAVVRYSEFFRAFHSLLRNPLVITSPSASVSSRLKQLMAEEISAGIACFLLREYLDVVHIVDYQVWRRSLNQRIVGRFPDYYCLTSSGDALLVEVKGTITKRLTAMNGPRSDGVLQVLNGVFGSEPPRAGCCRFVIATDLLTSSSGASRTYVDQVLTSADSSVSAELEKIQKPEVISNYSPEVLAQCKIFRYFDLNYSAERLLSGQVPFRTGDPVLSREFAVEIYDAEFIAIGQDPLGNVALLEREALANLQSGSADKLVKKNLKARKAAARTPKEKIAFPLSDEIVVCPSPINISADFENDR